MKRYIGIAIIIIGIISSCKKSGDFLDQVATTDLNEATVFADSARTLQFLTRVYTDVGFSADPKRFGGSIGIYSLGDESSMAAIGGTQWHVQFLSGTISSLQIPIDAWTTSYANIRRINIFLKNLPNSPLSDNLKNTLNGEAHFMRAWYYFIMLKHYGGVPLIGDVVFTTEDKVPGKRNTFEECVNYIESECNAAAILLPLNRVGLDYGRANKVACLALKSRLLLYAASPLFNGRRESNGAGGFVPMNESVSPELKATICYPTYDKTRWEKAAIAAGEAMTGPFGLNEDNSDPNAPGNGFQRLFPMRVNSEYILANMMSNNRYLESMWDTPTRTGSGSSFPYQELVDAFGTINGKPISTDLKSPTNPNGYDPQNPYVNRDPRLGFTVVYNGQKRLNINKTFTEIYTYDTGTDATDDGYTDKPGAARTRTGYYTRKMIDENTINSTTSPASARCLPLIRYAELLLNRAEALNEMSDNPPAEVYELLGRLRRRAGINSGADGFYGIPEGISQNEMRTIIQNERRIELAFEEHRYWDVRRWGIAGLVANKTLHGMKITKINATPTYTYQLVDVRTPVFVSPKWYLWPIHQNEIDKSLDLVQNPGW